MTNIKSENTSIEDLVDRMIDWVHNPESDPELNCWYANDYPDGKSPITFPSENDNFEDYYSLYQNGLKLEESGNRIGAFKQYIKVLDSYTPLGSVYYTAPFYIAEEYGFYSIASEICDMAISVMNEKLFNGDLKEFTRLKKRVGNKLLALGPDIFEGRINRIKSLIRTNPDLNKTKLFSALQEEQWSELEVKNVLDYCAATKQISIEKKGRSYKYTVLKL